MSISPFRSLQEERGKKSQFKDIESEKGRILQEVLDEGSVLDLLESEADEASEVGRGRESDQHQSRSRNETRRDRDREEKTTNRRRTKTAISSVAKVPSLIALRMAPREAMMTFARLASLASWLREKKQKEDQRSGASSRTKERGRIEPNPRCEDELTAVHIVTFRHGLESSDGLILETCTEKGNESARAKEQ